MSRGTSIFCPVLAELLQSRRAVGRTPYFAIRLLIEGGVVAFDDSSNPHVAKTLRFLRTSVPRAALEEVDLRHYREKGNQLSYRIARYFRQVQLTAFRRIGDVERAWDAPFHSF